MIDLKALRSNPERFRDGARRKNIAADIDRIVELDTALRALTAEQEQLRSQQNLASKAMGPQIGKLSGQLRAAQGEDRQRLDAEIAALKAEPERLKAAIQILDEKIAGLTPELQSLLLNVPQPPDADVPVGTSADDNVELRVWASPVLDPGKSFVEQRGFAARTHLELCESLGLVDFPRGVKMAGTRSYVLTGLGYRLHQAVLRYAIDFMTDRHGFTPVSVPVLVREEAMVGTGFFPGGREQSYLVDEVSRGSGQDMFLTGTGEVGLMGVHQGEILDEATLPRKYVTVSTCFRREAGAAGKDTAGLYRIHQFDKVEQVIICKADETESRLWHQTMLSYVEELLQSLELPYRLLQCCTGDLGVKNADMVDVECWMPGRGDEDAAGRPTGAFGETHSASRLYDFQCRRLNMRYRPGGEGGKGPTVFCHSLNNTVAASPRLLIPLLEVHQQVDGSVLIPEPLRMHMGGLERIAPGHGLA